MTEEIEARKDIQSCEVALKRHVERMLRQVFADPDVRGLLDQIGGWDVKPFLRRCLIAEIEQQLQPTPRRALEIQAGVERQIWQPFPSPRGMAKKYGHELVRSWRASYRNIPGHCPILIPHHSGLSLDEVEKILTHGNQHHHWGTLMMLGEPPPLTDEEWDALSWRRVPCYPDIRRFPAATRYCGR